MFGAYLLYSLGRNSKFGVYMHVRMAECHHFRVTVTLTSDLVLIMIVAGASLILFENGIPNLVCECILGWWSVLYHLRVTVTLTSDLVFRKNHVHGISLILLKVGIPNLVCGCNFDGRVLPTIFGSL